MSRFSGGGFQPIPKIRGRFINHFHKHDINIPSWLAKYWYDVYE